MEKGILKIMSQRGIGYREERLNDVKLKKVIKKALKYEIPFKVRLKSEYKGNDLIVFKPYVEVIIYCWDDKTRDFIYSIIKVKGKKGGHKASIIDMI